MKISNPGCRRHGTKSSIYSIKIKVKIFLKQQRKVSIDVRIRMLENGDSGQ